MEFGIVFGLDLASIFNYELWGFPFHKYVISSSKPRFEMINAMQSPGSPMQRKCLFSAKICSCFILALGGSRLGVQRPPLPISLPFVIVHGRLNLGVQQVKSHKLEWRKTAAQWWEMTYHTKRPQSEGGGLEYYKLVHFLTGSQIRDVCARLCACAFLSNWDQYLSLKIRTKRRISQFVSSGKCNFPPNTH